MGLKVKKKCCDSCHGTGEVSVWIDDGFVEAICVTCKRPTQVLREEAATGKQRCNNCFMEAWSKKVYTHQ